MLDAENPAENNDSSAGQAPDSPAEQNPAGGAPDAAAAPDGGDAPVKKAAAKRTAAKKTAAKKTTTAKKTAAKRTTKKAVAGAESEAAEVSSAASVAPAEQPGAGEQATSEQTAGEQTAGEQGGEAAAPAKKTARKAPAKKTAAKRTAKKATSDQEAPAAEAPAAAVPAETGDETPQNAPAATALLFQPPDPTKAVVTTRRRRTTKVAAAGAEQPETTEQPAEGESAPGEQEPKPAKKAAAKRTAKKAAAKPEAEPTEPDESEETTSDEAREGDEEQGGERRRRRRGGRRRRRSGGGGEDADNGESGDSSEGKDDREAERPEKGDRSEKGDQVQDESDEGGTGTRRRRRRRRSGDGEGEDETTPSTRARKPRNAEDEITALSGSTRLEAKKQRRREGREAGRRRAPIVSEAEFLARRESVDRVMVIRQREDLTQIAVLEDKVLVEHYVARESQTSLIGNVYLGRVQNVLPSMEAAFIDIGKGRNAVLYAGEVNWDALGAKNGTPRKIEAVLKSGQSILVQVTKDPIGHKGARLTSQVSLPGRFLVYVPDGTTSGISRKLPDTERNRLKNLLKEIVPDSAGVIVRTAAEGASEDELTRDVERLTARWADIESKVKGGNAPQLLYGEPDLTLKVVRDLFTEDFKKLVISGGDAWDLVEGYVSHVAPDLADRLEKYDGERDVFAEYRIDEQIEKALDRKVWLPSGGSLVIDRTEAMTVVDVNTGKFTGSGGNLEETVTKNNLEAAEEIVRQLRLRDIGGIIVVDFIDMVLESNRDLVLRRLVECLGRDRTRHQVAEVTSLGLVQMTRKRIGTGLLEAFTESCEHCQGRGLILHHEPIEPKKKSDDDSRGRGRRGGRKGRDEAAGGNGGGIPSPKDIAAMAKHEEKAEPSASAERTPERTPEQTPAETPEKTQEEPQEAAQASSPESGAVEAAPSAESRPARSRGGRGRGGRGRGAKGAEPTAEPTADSTGPEVSGEEPGTGEVPVQASEPAQPEPATDRAATEAAQEPAPPASAPGEPEAETKGAAEAPGQAGEAEPAASAAPTIVTSVRRRGARRAAGPPPGATVATLTVPAGAAADGSSVDGTGPAETALDEPADTEPIAALVEDAELDPDTDADAGETSATPHVPVKKRGSRRR